MYKGQDNKWGITALSQANPFFFVAKSIRTARPYMKRNLHLVFCNTLFLADFDWFTFSWSIWHLWANTCIWFWKPNYQILWYENLSNDEKDQSYNQYKLLPPKKTDFDSVLGMLNFQSAIS